MSEAKEDDAEKMIYEGKAKRIFALRGEPHKVRVEYKDSLTAFNALKKGSFEEKGQLNRDISSIIFRFLKMRGIGSHWIQDQGANSMIVSKVSIIPLEVVVRNTLAGSTAKKLGLPEGKKLKQPLVEFYYKNDELQDPFVSDDQILMLNLLSSEEIQNLKHMALKINSQIKELFMDIGIELIDFKIEFGKDSTGNILLADEITPDCCRLWDIETGEKMDKDRFRRDLGNVKESYQAVYNRLFKYLNQRMSL